MKYVHLILAGLVIFTGCGRKETQPVAKAPVLTHRADGQISSRADGQRSSRGGGQISLGEARKSFQTHLIRHESDDDPVPEPPPQLFRIVRYEAPAGKLAAYLTPDPHDGKKYPAIIWIFGGFGNGIGDTAWKDAPAENDQSARAFREARIVMMFPSLRGGHESLGAKEVCLGEVEDVLAAAEFLARQDFVDQERIYLGGHSTGGTLVLLAAASSDRFRAVFSFGPVDTVARYGPDNLPFDTSNQQELLLRAPVRWLQSIQNPVFVFEGTENGNLACLQIMSRVSTNPMIHFHAVPGHDHFNILAPVTQLIAKKILKDNGPTAKLEFTEKELSR